MLTSHKLLLMQSLKYDTEGYIPTMTSNTMPAPFVASADSTIAPDNGRAFGAFDNVSGSIWYTAVDSPLPHWLKIKLDKGVSIWKYTLKSFCKSSDNIYDSPVSWCVQGSNDNSTWEIIDSHANVTNWVHGETRDFILPQPSKKYLYYRFYCTLFFRNGVSTNLCTIDVFQIFKYGR